VDEVFEELQANPLFRIIPLSYEILFEAASLGVGPAFHKYFRKAKPALLAIWGKNDPFFIPAGAEAYRRDNPNAVVKFLNTGHFALETHVEEIAGA
jgi:pimeloyl-ACP methyl ester carboxylesterase